MKLQKKNYEYVVLFDIDGTLVTGPTKGPSAGLLSMNAAVAHLTGKDKLGNPDEFAGRTDVQIARMLLQLAGHPSPSADQIDELIEYYIRSLAANVVTHPYTALGNPKEAVRFLESDGAIIGLGTGNVTEGAFIKLKSAGIYELFDLSLGGFGADGDTRTELLKEGSLRCDPTGELPVVIVGDTPRDVRAAKDIDAYCVGIPYRGNTSEILTKSGSDAIHPAVDSGLVKVIRKLLGH